MGKIWWSKTLMVGAVWGEWVGWWVECPFYVMLHLRRRMHPTHVKIKEPGISQKKKYEVPTNLAKVGEESPKVRANPVAQYTKAPMQTSSQFLIKMLTVFLDLKNKQ